MERKAVGDDGCGAAVQVLDTLKEDGAMFDAVLDTVGGKEVREAIKKFRCLMVHCFNCVVLGSQKAW